MLATIMEGKADLADWMFLIAFIIFVVAAIVQWIGAQRAGVVLFLALVGLALVSFGLLAL